MKEDTKLLKELQINIKDVIDITLFDQKLVKLASSKLDHLSDDYIKLEFLFKRLT